MNQIILIETLYMLTIFLCSAFIFLKTRRLYNFSKYKGMKYYSSAFAFIALGFLFRYVVMILKVIRGNIGIINEFNLVTLIMETFLVLPGLFLFYSMVWQKFEIEYYVKKVNIYEIMIYLIAIIIAVSDTLIESFTVMYLSQIFLFLGALIISYKRYILKKNNSLQLFSISMFLLLLVWIFNFFAQILIVFIPMIRIYVYLLTVSACVILFYITLKLTGVRKTS